MRSEAQPGTCYLVNGAPPDGWVATRNNNYTMTNPFHPVYGADNPTLRVRRFTSMGPVGTRIAAMDAHVKRNYYVPEIKLEKGKVTMSTVRSRVCFSLAA